MQQFIIIMEGSKTLFYSSKLPQARERISSKFIDNLARALRMVSQPRTIVTSDIFRAPNFQWDLHSYVLQTVNENVS
jgi:hypothetical protein